MRVEFEWCSKCSMFSECYNLDRDESQHYAHFLEPRCGDGPCVDTSNIDINDIVF